MEINKWVVLDPLSRKHPTTLWLVNITKLDPDGYSVGKGIAFKSSKMKYGSNSYYLYTRWGRILTSDATLNNNNTEKWYFAEFHHLLFHPIKITEKDEVNLIKEFINDVCLS